MKGSPGRKERRQQRKQLLTKGYGNASQFAGTHIKKRKKKENSN